MVPGMVAWFAGSVPDGWLLCNGAAYSQADYPVLYTAIGHSFGEAYPGNFRVPDLFNRFARGSANVGGTGGANQVTLQVGHLPEHTHKVRCSAEDGDTDEPDGNYIAKAGEDIYATERIGNAVMDKGMIIPIGNGWPVPTVPPYVNLTPAICAG